MTKRQNKGDGRHQSYGKFKPQAPNPHFYHKYPMSEHSLHLLFDVPAPVSGL
jgi:hypothetical protein